MSFLLHTTTVWLPGKMLSCLLDQRAHECKPSRGMSEPSGSLIPSPEASSSSSDGFPNKGDSKMLERTQALESQGIQLNPCSAFGHMK